MFSIKSKNNYYGEYDNYFIGIFNYRDFMKEDNYSEWYNKYGPFDYFSTRTILTVQEYPYKDKILSNDLDTFAIFVPISDYMKDWRAIPGTEYYEATKDSTYKKFPVGTSLKKIKKWQNTSPHIWKEEFNSIKSLDELKQIDFYQDLRENIKLGKI